MEQLREHLGVERWLLNGGSWGSTLALAYAERYPHRVSEVCLSAITTGRRSEADWLYSGAARFFPGEWEQFRAAVPAQQGDGDLIAAYARLMEHSNRAVRERAAAAWCAWEDAVLSLEPRGSAGAAAGSGGVPSVASPTGPYSSRSPADLLAFVRICVLYLAPRGPAGGGCAAAGGPPSGRIPGVLIHGRLDLSCPMDTAWELAGAWPDAELFAPRDSGYLGSMSKRERLLAALDGFAIS